MPELPDLTLYVEALERFVVGHRLERLRIGSPFVLRTVDPPASAFAGKEVRAASRLGKRLVLELDDEHFALVHLMLTGRLHWRKAGARLAGRRGLAAFEFAHGSLQLTEESSKQRASLHLVRGRCALAAFDPGGVDPLADLSTFRAGLTRANHTLKRALSDPTLVAGIGNAYSDEILHRARLSPAKLTAKLDDEEVARLHAATRAVLTEWTERLRAKVGDKFPEKVTAFHEEMAVHGKHKEPCPVCGSPVQRVVSGETESNYCATCQTGGKLLRDRALSRLFRKDWPRTLEEMEERKRG